MSEVREHDEGGWGTEPLNGEQAVAMVDRFLESHALLINTVDAFIKAPITEVSSQELLRQLETAKDAPDQLTSHDYFKETGNELLVRYSVEKVIEATMELAALVRKVKPELSEIIFETQSASIIERVVEVISKPEGTVDVEEEEFEGMSAGLYTSSCYYTMVDHLQNTIVTSDRFVEFSESISRRQDLKYEVRQFLITAGATFIGALLAGLLRKK